jgi:hypothetical protein
VASAKKVLDISVNGMQEVDKILAKVSALENIVQSFQKTPLDLKVSDAKLDKLSTDLRVLDTEINNSRKTIDSADKSVKKYGEQIGELQGRIKELTPNTKAYNNNLEKQNKLQAEMAKSIAEVASEEEKLGKLQAKRPRISGSLANEQRAQKAIAQLRTLAEEYNKLGDLQQVSATGPTGNLKGFDQTTAQINAQVGALKAVAANVKIASSEFNRFSIAAEVASNKLAKVKQEQLAGLAFGLSPSAARVNTGTGGDASIAGSRKLVEETVTEYSTITKSEAALSAYLRRLENLRQLVPYISNEYKVLEERIAQVNSEINNANKPRIQAPEVQIKQGPASDLGSLRAFEQKARYRRSVENELERQVGIEKRIEQAVLNETDKAALRNQLEKATNAIYESRLEDAIRISREIDKQRFSLERLNRSQKVQAGGFQSFGTLGQDFMPISGELPSRVNELGARVKNLVPGSPAARLEEAKKAMKDMSEAERMIADAWRMRGGPALPPGMQARKSKKGGVYRGTQFSPVGGKRRLDYTLASGAIVEQGLINLRSKGVDVEGELVSLQKALNDARSDEFDISQRNLDVLGDQVALAGKFATLMRAQRAGGAGGNGAAAPTGLQEALKRITEARGAGKQFFGDVSPAQAIDQIVREFNTGKPIEQAKGAGQNIVQTFVNAFKKGSPAASTAGKSFATSATKGVEDGFGIASPSRFMIEVVKNLVTTYINELRDAAPSIKAATEKAFGQRSPESFVRKLTATNRGFEFVDRPSTGYKPLQSQVNVPSGMGSEADAMFRNFRNQIAALTTQPKIYGNILNALPSSSLTTNLVGAANQRAGMVESYPGMFMNTQRQLGPGELERVIQESLVKYLRSARTPNPWVGVVKDYQEFTKQIASSTRVLSRQAALPPGRIAGLLPQSTTREARVATAYQRSRDRGAAVLAEDLANRNRAAAAAGGMGGGGGRVPPGGALVPFGGGGGRDPGDFVNRLADAVQRGANAVLSLEELRNPAMASINELNALSAALNEMRAVLSPTVEGFDQLDNQLRETIANLDRQTQMRAPGAGFLERRFGPRTAQGLSEGLIGGAFPLLFGQGTGASIGGGLGGFAGGFAGGGLGFGLSLIGTAAGTAFDTFMTNLKGLADSLSDPTSALEAMKTAGLSVSKEVDRTVKSLESSGNAYGAQVFVLKEFERQLGTGSVRSLQALTAEQKKLDEATSKLSANIISTLLPAIVGFIATLNDLTGPLSQLSGSKMPDWMKDLPLVAGAYAVGSVSAGIGPTAAYAMSGLLQRGRQAAAAQSGRPEVQRKTMIESEISAYQKELETIDIAKPLIDQIRQAAREQRDLDKQNADLVRSYEESLGQLRQSIEDEVARRRFMTLEKENELLDIQGENRLKELEIINSKIIAGAGAGQLPEVQSVAREVATIVADFTQSQLSAEEEAAKIKRKAALDARQLDFEAAKFKAGIEKEISRLNIETARQVANINEQVIRRNEDANQNRFVLERSIARLNLLNAIEQAKLDKEVAQTSLDSTRNTPQERYSQGILDRRSKILDSLNVALQQVSSIQAPAKLKQLPAFKGGGISTGELDTSLANQKESIRKTVEESLKGVELSKVLNAQDFINKMETVATMIEKPLADIGRAQKQEEDRTTRYMQLIRSGASDIVATKIIEVEQAQKLVDLSYQEAIAILEKQKAVEGISKIEKDRIDTAIKMLKVRRGEVPGVTSQLTTSVVDTYGQRNEIQTQANAVEEQLNALISKSYQAKEAAKAIGASFSDSFKNIINGTMTAQEALASFFQSIANHFLDMASQIIAKWIEMTILNTVLSLFPGGSALGNIGPGSGFAGGGSASSFGVMPGMSFFDVFSAKGNAFAQNGIVPFAMGGIVNSPTLFKFADGGAMRNGLMGEAGPEAIMPLTRGPGGRLGVDASGGGGDTISVVVNVDASGSKVSGSDTQANQLGRVVAAAVRSEIVQQKRPGGLLA